MTGNRRRYTHLRLPASLSTTGSTGLGPHPQSQMWNELALLDPLLRASTSSGPPPAAATTSLCRGSVGESEQQVTNLPPR